MIVPRTIEPFEIAEPDNKQFPSILITNLDNIVVELPPNTEKKPVVAGL